MSKHADFFCGFPNFLNKTRLLLLKWQIFSLLPVQLPLLIIAGDPREYEQQKTWNKLPPWPRNRRPLSRKVGVRVAQVSVIMIVISIPMSMMHPFCFKVGWGRRRNAHVALVGRRLRARFSTPHCFIQCLLFNGFAMNDDSIEMVHVECPGSLLRISLVNAKTYWAFWRKWTICGRCCDHQKYYSWLACNGFLNLTSVAPLPFSRWNGNYSRLRDYGTYSLKHIRTLFGFAIAR